jgi:PAS domain S-box-containing protein
MEAVSNGTRLCFKSCKIFTPAWPYIDGPMNTGIEVAPIVFRAVNQISDLVAYWDIHQTCIYANEAYQRWFGKNPEQMRGITSQELLGPVLYEQNLPHILAVLQGEKQVFRRNIADADGVRREVILTYTPDIIEGKVWGFTTHGADITALREREAVLEKALRTGSLAWIDLRISNRILPICSFCKAVRDETDQWQSWEQYMGYQAKTTFSHGVCPACKEKHYGALFH